MQAMSAKANDEVGTSVNPVGVVAHGLPNLRQMRARKAAICSRVTLPAGS